MFPDLPLFQQFQQQLIIAIAEEPLLREVELKYGDMGWYLTAHWVTYCRGRWKVIVVKSTRADLT